METDENKLALAPGSGSGVGKLLAESLLADSDFVPELKKTAREGLRATRSYGSRDGPVTEADFRVRIQTLTLLLAHMEGEPVKRIIHEHLSGPNIDPLAAMRESPELREAAKHLIEKAEWRHGGGERSHQRKIEREEADREEAEADAEERRAERARRAAERAKRVAAEPPVIDIDPEAPGSF